MFARILSAFHVTVVLTIERDSNERLRDQFRSRSIQLGVGRMEVEIVRCTVTVMVSKVQEKSKGGLLRMARIIEFEGMTILI